MIEQSIKIFISGRQYPLKVSSGSEELLRKAVKKIDLECENIKKSKSTKDDQDVLAMCAYTFAAALLVKEKEYEIKMAQYEKQLKHIESLLDI